MRREEGEGDDDALAQSLEVVLLEASVDDVEEDGGNLGRASEGVFDGGVFREKLGGEVVGGDVLVVGREGVAAETEGADPQFPAHVDLAVGVEDRATGRLARHGLVQHRREIHSFLERSVQLNRTEYVFSRRYEAVGYATQRRGSGERRGNVQRRWGRRCGWIRSVNRRIRSSSVALHLCPPRPRN